MYNCHSKGLRERVSAEEKAVPKNRKTRRAVRGQTLSCIKRLFP